MTVADLIASVPRDISSPVALDDGGAYWRFGSRRLVVVRQVGTAVRADWLDGTDRGTMHASRPARVVDLLRSFVRVR